MPNLEVKSRMSAIQLAIVVAGTGIGTAIIVSTTTLVKDASQAAWIGLSFSGLIYYGVTWMMVKLGQHYPDDTLVEYMPRLWGRAGGSLVIWLFAIMFLLQVSTLLAGFSRIILFYLFDRTPYEMVELIMLAVCVYCAMQDWGTLLRVMQIIFFAATPVFYGLMLVSLLNFKPENMLPLSLNIGGLTKVVPTSWGIFSGYELVLLLLPMVYRGKVGIAKALGGAFGCMTLIFSSIVILTIGVLTAEEVKQLPYAVMTTIRSIELPGTFVERLEIYLLLIWTPIAFDTLVMFLWVSAQTLMRYYGYKDHRPFVLLFVPIFYTIAVLCQDMGVLAAVNKWLTWIGLIFSFFVVPVSLLLAWRKKRGEAECGE